MYAVAKLAVLFVVLLEISLSESRTFGRRSPYRDPYRHTPVPGHVELPSGPFSDPTLMPPSSMPWSRIGSVPEASDAKHSPGLKFQQRTEAIVFQDDDSDERRIPSYPATSTAKPANVTHRPLVFLDDDNKTASYPTNDSMDDKRNFPVYPNDEITWVPQVNRSACVMGALCENVSNYPTEAIARLMESGIQQLNLNLASIFSKGNDEAKFGSDVLTRNNVDRPDEKPLCETERKTMHLKSALNTDKEFRFIINSVEYSQKVMTEICRGESKPCSHVSSPIGSETVCRQKYVEVFLLAVNEVGKPVMDTFRIPSSCVCYSKLSPSVRRAARNSS